MSSPTSEDIIALTDQIQALFGASPDPLHTHLEIIAIAQPETSNALLSIHYIQDGSRLLVEIRAARATDEWRRDQLEVLGVRGYTPAFLDPWSTREIWSEEADSLHALNPQAHAIAAQEAVALYHELYREPTHELHAYSML